MQLLALVRYRIDPTAGLASILNKETLPVSTDDWRSPAAYDYAQDLDHPAFAWEFLRRNPGYREAFDANPIHDDRGADGPASDWGLRFMADPARQAADTPVFWHPDELPTVIPVTAASAATATPPVPLAEWPGEIVKRHAADGVHILIRSDRTSHQIWLLDPSGKAVSVSALIPLDATAPQKTDALLCLWRFVTRRRCRAHPSSRRRIDRLVATLRALDARMAGASYRTIAETLFGPKRVAAEPWKTAPVRDTVIRIVRAGFALKRGGYRRLLRTPWHA